MDVQTGTGITFERFWRWLQGHKNCIIRAGGLDAYLYDQEEFHWQLEEDAQKTPIVQLCRAKEVVAELVLDVREVMFVQFVPEPGNDAGHFLFELVGQPQGESVTAVGCRTAIWLARVGARGPPEAGGASRVRSDRTERARAVRCMGVPPWVGRQRFTSPGRSTGRRCGSRAVVRGRRAGAGIEWLLHGAGGEAKREGAA